MNYFNKTIALVIALTFTLFGCDNTTSPHTNSNNDSSGFYNSAENGTGNEGETGNIIVIDEKNLDSDWSFVPESGESGSGNFVEGPGTPVIGSGSASFSLNDNEDGLALFGAIFEGSTPLSTFSRIGYNTFQGSAGSVQAVALQFHVNYDGNNDWQGRLVFEPYHDGTVEQSLWQTWNPLEQRGWWATGAAGAELCTQDELCTWNEILDEFPNAVVRAEEALDNVGFIIFKAGSNWGEFLGYVDGFELEIAGELFTYSFEAEQADDENGDNGEEDENGDDNGEDGEDGENGDNGDEEENGDDSGENGDDEGNGDNGEEDENGDDNGEDGEDEENGDNGDEEENGDNGEEDENGDDSGENGEDEENGDNGDDEEEETVDDPDNPSVKEDCKNGGWEVYGFRNQGLCIQYVNTGKDSRNDSANDDENSSDDNGDNESDNGEEDDPDNGGENENGDNEDNEENGDENDNGDNEENGDGDDSDDSDEEESADQNEDPNTIEECRNGGWQDFGFRNQGQCIQFVNTGKDSR